MEKKTSNQKSAKKYWHELYQESLRETLDELDIKGERIKLIIQIVLGSLILGLVTALSFLGIKGYSTISSGIVATVVGGVVTALAIFIGLVWGARLIALGNIFRIAAKRDEDKQQQINDFEERLNPAKLTLDVTPYNHPGEQKISIAIRAPQKITSLRVEMKMDGLIWITNGQRVPHKDIEISAGCREFTDGDHFREPRTIFPNDYVIVHIAEVKKDRMVWLLDPHYPNDGLYDKKGEGKRAEFILSLLIDGILQERGISIEQQRGEFSVIFENGKQDDVDNYGRIVTSVKSRLWIGSPE